MNDVSKWADRKLEVKYKKFYGYYMFSVCCSCNNISFINRDKYVECCKCGKPHDYKDYEEVDKERIKKKKDFIRKIV